MRKPLTVAASVVQASMTAPSRSYLTSILRSTFDQLMIRSARPNLPDNAAIGRLAPGHVGLDLQQARDRPQGVVSDAVQNLDNTGAAGWTERERVPGAPTIDFTADAEVSVSWPSGSG